ncbi:hypothetical protein LCGC14_0219890 [marine sediment metagenome]|uniref:Uncharacterized protein n=1 Tax=marine sediment metagenome TaxID=412755 RepID=A0A0F9UHI3_9ZZZZ
MFKCRHKKSGPVGETFSPDSLTGGDVELYWCPRCGAIGHKQLFDRLLQPIVWTKPGLRTICPRVPGE